MIKNIILDIGNVLMVYNPRVIFPKYFPLEAFDGVVVSSDVHMIKPDIRICQYLLEKYGLQPQECLFIDDREENVEGARTAGMEAVVFQNNFTEIAKLI